MKGEEEQCSGNAFSASWKESLDIKGSRGEGAEAQHTRVCYKASVKGVFQWWIGDHRDVQEDILPKVLEMAGVVG